MSSKNDLFVFIVLLHDLHKILKPMTKININTIRISNNYTELFINIF